ncbi:MAG: acetyl-CoA C-acetyltransferase [Bdellovibrionota bacterium]
MRSDANQVYILGSSRTPFAKSQTVYADVTRKELMVASLNGLIRKNNLQKKFIGDTALGCLMNSSKDWNLARECVLETELDPNSPAYNTQRACALSLDNVWQIAMKIHTGAIDIGIAGGVDTNSDFPIEVSDKFRKFLMKMNNAKSFGARMSALSSASFGMLKPSAASVTEPRTLMSMGQHCELMAKEWKISREEQDEIAYNSHINAAKAYDSGFFDDLVIPFHGITRDATLRADTSKERLAKLKPSFDPQNGTLTAGNSSPLTDGAASVLLGSESAAQKMGLFPMAKVIDVQVAAVDFVHGAGLLMAPTKAVAQLLIRNNLTFKDFDYFEIHEAFAAQVLCNLKAWESATYCKDVLGLKSPLGAIDRSKMNVVGSSVAMGHPFAATGARITGTLAKLLASGSKKRGLISICTAGGMGVAAILESV